MQFLNRKFPIVDFVAGAKVDSITDRNGKSESVGIWKEVKNRSRWISGAQISSSGLDIEG